MSFHRPDWNIRFWAQNLTDDRNVTGSGIGNSSVGHTTGVFVREGRSFEMSFGTDLRNNKKTLLLQGFFLIVIPIIKLIILSLK